MEPGRSGEILSTLIGQIVRKNQSALAELYDRTNPLVYGLALRIVREPSVAEDIMQEVYMQVWRRADAFDPERGAVLSWIVTIARSRALDRLRSSNARLTRENQAEDLDTFCSPGPDPERDISEFEHGQLVRRFLYELPRDQRRVIELAFFHGFTHTEIASRTGLPLGTIKSRIRSGMLKLREQLGFLEESFTTGGSELLLAASAQFPRDRCQARTA
jgi:RNA polymerase sigma-70 factor (ECF subfamily)